MLQIVSMRSGATLWEAPIEAGERFSHRYIHSVERSEVREVFTVRETGDIVAMESWTRSFGAGLPYERKGEVSLEQGYYVLRNIEQTVDQLHMMPSHLFPHTFHFKNITIDLHDRPFVRNLLTIRVVPISHWKQLIYGRVSNEEKGGSHVEV